MTFTGTLRGFQEPAVARMVERGQVLVAYEMGLGKTVLTIAAVEHLLETEEVREGLIIVPASLKYQWEQQIHQFTDNALVLVIDGTPEQRRKQYAEANEYEYVILTYEQVLNDWDHVKNLGRDFVVLDEATAIKNFKAKRTKKVKRLDSDFRFALTGQPVENRPEEIFSIMEWVDQDVLGRFDIFDRTFVKRNHFGGVQYYKNLPVLHERLVDAMVRKRRDDADVRDELPAVIEETVLTKLDGPARALYHRICDDLMVELDAAKSVASGWDMLSHYGRDDGGSAHELEQRGRIMSRLTCLRMLCDHPDLLRRSADLFDGHLEISEGIKGGSSYASELKAEGALDPLKGSPKLAVLVEQLDDVLQADSANKIVVFSFFKSMLGHIADATAKLSPSVLFTGDMSARERQDAKEEFQTDPKTRLFLSSDAGGYGVDLPQANYLASVDLPWSAGKWDQRNARIIRLSSEWEHVTLLNFLIKGSIEQRQYEMLTQKRAIASAVVDGRGIDAKGQLQLSLDSLSQFIADTDV